MLNVKPEITKSSRTKSCVYERYAFGMAKKKRKSKPARKSCGCVKMTLGVGPVLVRCAKHRGKPSKDGRVLCYFNDEGQVRFEP